MDNFKKITLNFFFIVSILLFSCVTGHHLRNDIIYKDVNFTYNHLMNSRMIIGGIFIQLTDLTSILLTKYSALLSNILSEKFLDVHTINTLQLIDEFDKEKYIEMMRYFDWDEIFKKETIQFIRDSIPDTKYILLAYIEKEDIIENSYEEYIEDRKGKEKLKTDYKKTYLLTIEFKIYDVLQEKLVWNNIIQDEFERTESRTTRTGFFGSIVDNIIQDKLLGEPAEIYPEEVLTKIVEKFAEDLIKTRVNP